MNIQAVNISKSLGEEFNNLPIDIRMMMHELHGIIYPKIGAKKFIIRDEIYGLL